MSQQKKYVVRKDPRDVPQVPDIAHETLFNHMADAEKSGIYLRLKGVNETHLKFEATVYYYFDGKQKGRLTQSSGALCHQYQATALIPFVEWHRVANLKGSLDGYVNYAWPKDIKEYIRFRFVRTYS